MAGRGISTRRNVISETAIEQEITDLEITREIPNIDYEIGDNVVYPHHGAGKVLKKEMKVVLGEKRNYLTIQILHNDMTVMVPCENAGKAGLRRVIGEEAVAKVVAILQDAVSEMPKNWNRRFKHNREKIKTGDVYELAEVVRNLAIRESEKGLSTGEKQMYTRAKKILASELMYALEMDEDGAEEHLDTLIESAHEDRMAATALALQGYLPWSWESSRPAAAANALVPIGPRRSSSVGAGRCSTGASTCSREVCERVVVAVPEGYESGRDRVRGADVRSASVRAALAAAPEATVAVVHDAARPLVTADLVRRCVAALDESGVDGAIAAARVTDTSRRPTTTGASPGRSTARSCGLCRPRRCSGPTCCAARSTCATRCSPRRPTTPPSSKRRAAASRWSRPRPRTLRSRPSSTCSWSSGCSPPAPDADRLPRAPAARRRRDRRGKVLHGRERPRATARRPASAGSPSSAWPSTSTGSRSASTSGSTRGGCATRSTTSTSTASSSARRPTSSSVSRPTSCPGAEDRTAELLDAREWDYVVGSIHFLRDRALDLREWDVWEGATADEVWSRYFETLGEAAASGLFDILAHPDLVKVWGKGAPVPDGDLRRFYELAMEGIAGSDIAIEVSTAGLRKPVGEIYPAREVPRAVPRGRPARRALERRSRVRRTSGTNTIAPCGWLREEMGVERDRGVRGP